MSSNERSRYGDMCEWLGYALWSLSEPSYAFNATIYLFLRARHMGDAKAHEWADKVSQCS